MERILVIDDDVELWRAGGGVSGGRRLSGGVHPRGDLGLQRAVKGEHILIVLDVMLPG